MLIAGGIGFFTETRKQGIDVYLALWAIVFPIQTIVAFSESSDDINALIPCLGICFNRLGLSLRERRAASEASFRRRSRWAASAHWSLSRRPGLASAPIGISG